MAISFFTQSKKEVAPIWVRFRSPSVDAKARTNLTIDNGRLHKGKVTKYKASSSSRADKNIVIKKNIALDVVIREMASLELEIRTLANQLKPNEVINSKWLKKAVQPQLTDNTLLGHIDIWLASKTDVKPSSIARYKAFKNVIIRFEKDKNLSVNLLDIDLKFSDDLLNWFRETGYSNNTTVDSIKLLKQVLKFSHKRGETVHRDYLYLTDGLKHKKTLKVFLTMEELKTIIDLELEGKMAIARDWLVVSCFTGQRYISFSKFTKNDIKDGVIEWQQIKTDQTLKVLIPILPQVQHVLDKYKGNFPPTFSENPKNGYKIYDRLLKKVCKEAGLTQKVQTMTSKSSIQKSEKSYKMKWEVVGSHVGRRSFATNLYGKIPTAQIMAITGHTTEASFLTYIDKARAVDTDKLKQDMINALK